LAPSLATGDAMWVYAKENQTYSQYILKLFNASILPSNHLQLDNIYNSDHKQ